MTKILALDTTLGACSVAISKDGDLLATEKEVRARGHVERLMPMVKQICEQAGLSPDEIDLIAVTKGPGTFAGVRIGLAVAKGLALALDIDVVAVTSLEAIANEYAIRHAQDTGKIAVAIDARRGEVYLQSFGLDKGKVKTCSEPVATPIGLASEHIAADISLMIGGGAELLADLKIEIKAGYHHPDAQYICRFIHGSPDHKPTDADNVSPLYLRAPDAIRPKPLDMKISDD